MKKFLTLGISLCAATGLFANIINWELGNVTNDDDTALSNYDIVFLTGVTAGSDGTYAVTDANINDGSNSGVQTDGEGIWGTWTDTVSTNPTTYFVAVKSGDTYYAVVDSNDDALTYTYTGNASPSMGGTFESGSETTYKTAGHVAAVPEPATVVMALAGVALLIRRRKSQG